MIKLDQRLSAVYDEILPCKMLVDIGTDHGMVTVKAVLEGKAEKAIAGDISSDSLDKARHLSTKYALDNKIDCRLGDGLDSISIEEYDTLLIAGIGGFEIINILSRAKAKFQLYILLPHRNAVELREFLCKNDIAPYKDYLVTERDKYYNIIVARAGKYNPSDIELNYGKSRRTPIFREYLIKEIDRLREYSHKGSLQKQADNQLLIKKLEDMYDNR